MEPRLENQWDFEEGYGKWKAVKDLLYIIILVPVGVVVFLFALAYGFLWRVKAIVWWALDVNGYQAKALGYEEKDGCVRLNAKAEQGFKTKVFDLSDEKEAFE